MKKYSLLLSILATIILVTLPELEAKGGGRGGGGGRSGGGGGGGHRGGGGHQGGGGRTIQRSPSMSRTSNSRPTNKPQTMPQRSEGHRPESRPESRPAQHQQSGNKPTTSSVKEFAHSHPSATHPNHADRHNHADNVRHGVHTHRPYSHNWFNNNFWVGHHYYPAYYHSHNNWWRWATPVGIGAWLGWSAAPIYYDYYIDNGAYYWGPSTVVTPTTTVYAQQPPVVVSAAQPQESNDDWMPLGVFALTKEGSILDDSNMYIQLALNKNGTIAGSFYNSTTDEGHEITGSIDPDTQMVTLQNTNDPDAPILETGVYNLSQSEAPIQVHFSDGRTTNMLLVRLEEPQ